MNLVTVSFTLLVILLIVDVKLGVEALALVSVLALISVRPHAVMLVEHDVHEARPVVRWLVMWQRVLAIFVPVVVEVFEELQLVKALVTCLRLLLVLLLHASLRAAFIIV